MFAKSIPQFTLQDTNGIVHRQSEWQDKSAIVIFFTTTDCPLSNGYIPEMNRIYKSYASRRVAFFAVQADTTIEPAAVQRHTKEFGFLFPVLLDPQQTLVKLTSATATPEVAVLSRSGDVLYLGRIDNRVEDFDQRRSVATQFDLRNAIDAVLSGRPVQPSRTKVVGCAINYVNEVIK